MKTKTGNEISFIITGKLLRNIWKGVLIHPTEGSPHEVEFDHKFVLSREENKKDILGFYHTHPNVPASPSQTDHNTMNAWTTCLGKPLFCLIDGEDGLKGYCYLPNEENPIECEIFKIGRYVVGEIPWLM